MQTVRLYGVIVQISDSLHSKPKISDLWSTWSPFKVPKIAVRIYASVAENFCRGWKVLFVLNEVPYYLIVFYLKQNVVRFEVWPGQLRKRASKQVLKIPVWIMWHFVCK